jgi:membrane-bound serine protease (ClpP class)
MAISFVVNSLSVTADEALKENVIDMVVGSPDEMLRQMNGLSVTINDQKQQLDTSDAQIFVYEKSLREQFLEIISNPNLFYLLFIVGIIGLGIELTNPGALIPGVLGGIALIMALIATSVLPVNFGAMLLILISVAFMVAEVFIPSFGILGIGGFVAFLIGSVLLIDSSDELGLTISWWTIVPGALGVAAFGGLVSYLVMKTERTQVHSGVEGLKGHRALAIESFGNGRGRVRMDGEYWNARLADGVQRQIEEGEELNVVAVDGLTLIVEPRSAV